MSITQNVATILKDHTTLEVEGIDRMYLNVLVPHLQWDKGIVGFFRKHLGQPVASSALMAPRTRDFVAAVERFVKARSIPVVQFRKDERKDDVMADRLKHFRQPEGVVFVGKAQEKTPVFRTEKRRNPQTGDRCAWIVKSTALVNHYYFYCVDCNFGPFFLKFFFFEQVIRENIDLGRPDQVQLIFGRQVRKTTPGRFRTRVITDGVTPSLHVDYKSSRIKQYHKEARALRTETTINNPQEFSCGKRRCHLPRLRQIGFQANRRLIEVECLSHDCRLGEEAFQQLGRPREVNGQRASALRFTDPRVLVLWTALVLFRLRPCGFAHRDWREQVAALTGQQPPSITPGRMTYDLRRLRLHGFIERTPRTHRYQVTEFGLRASLFFTRVHARILRPGLSEAMPNAPPLDSALQRCFQQLEAEIDRRVEQAKLAG